MNRTPSTARLLLRKLSIDDVDAFSALAGERAVADTMISIPHPLTRDAALAWLAAHTGDPERYRSLAVCLSATGDLIGYAGIVDIDREHCLGELSFWIGRPFRGAGYAVEAGRAAIGVAFGELGLNRLQAFHMLRNPASGRVLERLGFRREGVLRQRVRKWNTFEDVAAYGLLRSDTAVAAS